MRIVTGFRAAAAVSAAFFLASAGAAWAYHPLVPTNLRQNEGSGTGPSMTPGTLVPTGSNVFLTATMPGGTNGTGYYEVEVELRDVGQAFTGVPTHSAGSFTGNKAATDVESSGLLFSPPTGQWKWQARMKSGSSSSSTTASAWQTFNAGNLAFEVAPPNVPDILVDSTTVQMGQNPPPNTLVMTVEGVFRNRGAVPTGPFQWNVYLSTNQTLDASDTLLWSSTTALDLAAAGQPLSTQNAQSDSISIDPKPPAGAYFILIQADPAPLGCSTNCGAVAEFDETNNVRSTATYFINGVDLVATSISNGPANAQPGNSFNLTVSFFNQGVDPVVDSNEDLVPVNFRIVASRNPPLTLQDQIVYQNNVTFLGGQTHNLTIPITLPPGIAGGQVTWGLIVDPLNQVTEALENNNSAISATQSLIVQADLEGVSADLVDVFSGVSVRTGDFGQPAKFRFTVKNVGNFTSIPTHVGVILSKDNNLSLLSDLRIGDIAVPGGLAAGATTTYEVMVTLPTQDAQQNPLVTGDYHFFLQADSFNVINEINESNNVALVSGPARLRTPQQDYAVPTVRAPATVGAGDTLLLERRIQNLGTDDGQPAEYACFASVNAIVSPTDFSLPFIEADGQTTVPRRTVTLAKGGSDQRTELVRVPGHLPAGAYYFGCIVDPDGALSELDKTNNTGVSTTTSAVIAQAFQIALQNLSDGTLGQPYNVRIPTVGGQGAVTFTATAIGPGLSLTTAGEVTGSPSEHGVHTFTAFAHAGGLTAQRTFTLRVLPPTAELTVSTDNLPPVINSTTLLYQAQLSAVGGVKPYTWALVSGTLPNGLTLGADTGIIGGTLKPGVPMGETTVSVRVRGALGSEATKQLKLRVVPPGTLVIASLSLPNAMVAQEYIADLAAQMSGGAGLAPPLTWEVVAGAFPPGLALETVGASTTAVVTGRPERAGPWTFTVQVRDAQGRTDVIDYVLVVHANALRVSWASPPPQVLYPGNEVDLAFAANGAGAVSFVHFSGGLPAGLELSADGKLTGTVSDDAVRGVHAFAVGANDALGARGIGSFALQVKERQVPDSCSTTGTGGLGLTGLLGLAMLGLVAFRRRRQA